MFRTIENELDAWIAAGSRRPLVLAKLRLFAEELPSLPVIAAGSLLEFELADHTYSMPVGRVGFRHIEPMTRFARFAMVGGL